MQTASGTVMSALATSEKDQRPWVASQKAAGGVINSGRISFTGPNGNCNILLRHSVYEIKIDLVQLRIYYSKRISLID